MADKLVLACDSLGGLILLSLYLGLSLLARFDLDVQSVDVVVVPGNFVFDVKRSF